MITTAIFFRPALSGHTDHMAGTRIVALVLLLTFGAGCAGWTYGPPRVVGQPHQTVTPGSIRQPVSVPSIEEGQRFDLFVAGIAIFGISYLLCQVPVAASIEDGIWAIPIVGPPIRWEEYSGSGFSMLVNIFGVVFALGEITGMTLFFYSLFSDPD